MKMILNHRRRAAALTAVAALLALVIGSSAAGADGGAGNTNNYTLSASANSLDILVNEPGAPLIQTYELSPYGSSAMLDSLGESSSDAGAPYSPLINSLPGLVDGLGSGGQLPPLPPLPGYVSATYPSTPSVSQKQAVYDVDATADQYSASGQVKLGVTAAAAPTSTLSASSSAVANPDGSVEVSASAGADLLNLGGVLDIGNVTSTATMTEQAGKTPTITGETNLGTVSVLGGVTGLLSSGLSVLGLKVPVPLTTTLIPVLNTVLKPLGVTLTYLPVTYTYTDGTTSTGTPTAGKTIMALDSGALKVDAVQNVPSQGNVSVDLTLGRVQLSATDTPGGLPSSGGGSVPPVVSSSGGVPAGSGPVIGGTNPSVSVPLPSGSTIPIAASGGQPAQTSGRRPLTLAVSYKLGPSAQSLYLLLVVAALVALLGSGLIRFMSIRLVFSPSKSRF